MSLADRVFELMDRVAPPQIAHAHCDVPCGIYDPHEAQIAAQTVQTMVTKMQALQAPGANADLAARQEYENTVVRMVRTKEDHAETLKRQVLILWTDYFKPEHLQRWPDLHTKVWMTCKKASQCKQTVNAQACQELVNMTNEIAEIFWESKK